MVHAAPLNVTVPPVGLKVAPEPTDMPPVIVIVPPVGAKVWLEFTVSVPVTANVALVCVIGVINIVKFLNDRVPELAMTKLLFVETVPPVGAKVWPLLTVNVPLI